MTYASNPAVMASPVTPPASLEYLPTPPWATRVLLRETAPELFKTRYVAADPCAGEGHMVHTLRGHFGLVHRADVFDYGLGWPVRDFLFSEARDYPGGVDWFFLNAPSLLLADFVLHALTIARVGVAVFAGLQWIAGGEQYRRLFGPTPPRLFCPFSDRVALIEGAWDPEASTETAYAWFVWHKWQRRNDPWEARLIPPGAESRHSLPEDLAFAKPGEAARRKAAAVDTNQLGLGLPG